MSIHEPSSPRFTQVTTNDYAGMDNEAHVSEAPHDTEPPEPPPRRSTRVRKSTKLLDPSSKGQSYDYSNLQFHCITQLSLRKSLKI